MAQQAYRDGVAEGQLDSDMASAIKASLESRNIDLLPGLGGWIPQSQSDWETYRHQQQLFEKAQADTTKLKDAPKRRHEQPTDSGRLEDFEDLPERSKLASGTTDQESNDLRAQKPEEDWKHHAENLLESLDSQSPTITTVPPASTSRSTSRLSGKQNINETNTQQIRAGQKASESNDGEKQADSSEAQASPPTDVSLAVAPTSRQTIEDRIKEMQAKTVVELPWTDDPDGDTYIYIDPPAQQPEQTDQMYYNYVERYRQPFVVRSTTLQALHSPFFDKLLGPTAQYRTRRRLNSRGPNPIKYVIDLTPPSEGEDAAWLMTELCCVEGVRNWNQACARWQISQTLVGGKDEFTAQPADGADKSSTPEFSPIRHRSSIERVLNAIRGIDPKLDSAVKVFTTFAVARFFDITHSPLTDYIVRWLRAPPNTLFIEVLPEIALKIGDGLHCHDLIRDSFAILVGEEALANLSNKSDTSYTIFGRKKNDVPETYRTRIEYASKSFTDRILQTFENLVEPDMAWMETLPQFRRLFLDHNTRELPLVKQTKAAFKASVRGAIYSVLWSDLRNAPKFELGCDKGDSLYPWTSQTEFWNPLKMAGRLMTTTFWTALRDFYAFGSFGTATNLTSWSRHIGVWGSELSNDKKKILRQKYGIVEIRYTYLDDLVTRCRMDRTSLLWPTHGCLKPLDYQPSISLSGMESSPVRGDQALELPAPGLTWKIDRASEKSNEDQESFIGKGGINIDVDELRHEIEAYISTICQQMLGPPDLSNREEPMRQVMTPTLVCLDEAEWKYLPLYAGGLDDESGGVFNDDVPMADTGFSTAGPGVHTGTGSSAASSEFEFVNGQELESTHHTSTMTNDSFSDQLDHRKVYSDDGELWDHIRNNKQFTDSTIASHEDMATVAAPSTVDAESEDDFVLPLRPKDSGAETLDKILNEQTPPIQNRREETVMPPAQEDYSDLFIYSDQEDMECDDDNDDTATEKGENGSDAEANELEQGHEDSEDEDLVLV
ncbi:MAG: hypothetical protein Q9172_000727 [Xanthocarpia lactea]